MAVGDFNADGMLDLATANFYDYYGDNAVSILFGNGDGTFDSAIQLSNGGQFIATGDLDGDADLDLVVTSNSYGGFGGSDVSVLIGHGDGTFALGGSYRSPGPTYVNLFAPVLGDFDRDGNADVAVAAGTWGKGLVKVFLGNGDGTLQQSRDAVAYTHTSHAAVNSATVGDFDNDNWLDLVTLNYNGTSSVLLGNGDGTFQPAQSMNNVASATAAGDVNGDGALDLVAGGATVLLGNGDGSFAPPIMSDSLAYWVVLADFNADTRLDAAGVNGSDTVSVLLNDGNWPLPAPPPSIRIGDVPVTEGNTATRSAAFTVTLSAAYSQPVTVAYATASGTATGNDYQAASGTVTIPAGQTTGTITVLVYGDRLGEANETFVVNLSGPTNATIADAQGVATILDDEPRISIGDVTKKEGKKGQTTLFTFTVTLSAAYDQAVTMSYATANGTAKTSDNDYVAKSGTLTFAPGETTKTITIEVKGDSKKEANETFYLDLFGLSSNALFTKNRGIGTILNDD